MNKKFLKMKLLISIIILCGACKKINSTFMEPVQVPIVKDTTGLADTVKMRPDTAFVTYELKEPSVPLGAKKYEVGTGSGRLVIDGKIMKISRPAIILIKGGKYESIEIKNLNGTSSQPIFIKNVGLVFISSYMSTSNISNVIISGDNTAGIKYGFRLQDISYRGLILYGKTSGVTIRNFLFKNIGDRSISGSDNNGYGLQYDGTANTRNDDFKVLNCLFDNAGSIGLGGTLNVDTKEDSGLFRNTEIAYNSFENSPEVGSVCYLANAQDYKIHHNTVNNINQKNNNHNGVFLSWVMGFSITTNSQIIKVMQ